MPGREDLTQQPGFVMHTDWRGSERVDGTWGGIEFKGVCVGCPGAQAVLERNDASATGDFIVMPAGSPRLSQSTEQTVDAASQAIKDRTPGEFDGSQCSKPTREILGILGARVCRGEFYNE